MREDELSSAEAEAFVLDQHARLEQHDRADGLSAFHELEGVVDLLQRHGVRDHGVDLNFAVHIPVDDLGHISSAFCAAEGGSAPHASCDELEGSCRDFCACGRNADDDALAPSFVAAFQGLSHRRGVADAFKRVVCSAFRERDEVSYEVVAFVELFRIDEVRHAELLAERLSSWVRIDADDHRGTYESCALDDIEPDAAQSEDDDASTWLDLGGIDDGSDSCCNAATDVADLVEGRVLADFGEGDLRHDGVFGEGGSSHVVEELFAVEREAGGSVGHDAFSLSCSDGLAEVGFS